MKNKRDCINYNNCKNPKMRCTTLYKDKKHEWDIFYSECCMDRGFDCLSFKESAE